MAHNSLCLAKEIPFNEIVPGRILHVRILGKNIALDVYVVLPVRLVLQGNTRSQ